MRRGLNGSRGTYLTEPSELQDDAPATALFPQFESQIYDMFSSEVEGLTEEQLDYESDRWEWSRWSIRRNVSHVASGDIRWLVLRWGETLFPQKPQELADLAALIAPDARLVTARFWGMDAILVQLRRTQGFSHMVLSRETVGSLRSREINADTTTGQWEMFSHAHPRGIRMGPEDPKHVYITLEATFRHRYFEHTTHLYNVQRLKRAQGLAPRVEIPFVGYYALPGWDRSEP